MKYICYRRFKDLSASGSVNIPYKTELTADSTWIYLNGKKICTRTSQNAYDYFAINEDGLGLERAKYTSSIKDILSVRDSKHQKRWDKLWADKLANTLRRQDYDEFWIWDKAFYEASIPDLIHILSLIKEV